MKKNLRVLSCNGSNDIFTLKLETVSNHSNNGIGFGATPAPYAGKYYHKVVKPVDVGVTMEIDFDALDIVPRDFALPSGEVIQLNYLYAKR
jgi:hypothetical protein